MDTRLKLKIQEQFQIIVHGPYMLKAHLDKHLSIDLHENHWAHGHLAIVIFVRGFFCI